MTEKPDNTEEAVAWQWRWEGQSKWNFLDYLPRPDADESEPLFPLSSLETRDARIAELEDEVVRHARDMMVYREAHDQKAARLAEAVGALEGAEHALNYVVMAKPSGLDEAELADIAKRAERARQALSSVGEG